MANKKIKEKWTKISRDNLNTISKIKGITQVQLANHLGIHIDYFRKQLQNGEIQKGHLLSIAELLNITPEYLTGDINISFDEEAYLIFSKAHKNKFPNSSFLGTFKMMYNESVLVNAGDDPLLELDRSVTERLKDNYFLNPDIYSYKFYYQNNFNYKDISLKLVKLADYIKPLGFGCEDDKQHIIDYFSFLLKDSSLSFFKSLRDVCNILKLIEKNHSDNENPKNNIRWIDENGKTLRVSEYINNLDKIIGYPTIDHNSLENLTKEIIENIVSDYLYDNKENIDLVTTQLKRTRINEFCNIEKIAYEIKNKEKIKHLIEQLENAVYDHDYEEIKRLKKAIREMTHEEQEYINAQILETKIYLWDCL